MKSILIAVILTVAAAASGAEDLGLTDFLSDEYISHINAQATTWKAGRNFPENTPLSHIRSLLGTLISDHPLLEEKKEDTSISDDSIPESFDARERWPQCTGISTIPDQSYCGSCWAVAAASTISDRICIHSNGTKQVTISAVDLMSCCGFFCSRGCDGGFADHAWSHWTNTGIVTGGVYGSGVGCKPYPFPPCAHGVDGSRYSPCPDKQYEAPSCVKKCDDSAISYSADFQKGKSTYTVRGITAIQKEILLNGPMEASYDVYSDFTNYKSGVYQTTKGAKSLGKHSVRLLGWGTENGTPYWLVANSWNDNWGDKGFFKIIRGKNECHFETNIIGGIPK